MTVPTQFISCNETLTSFKVFRCAKIQKTFELNELKIPLLYMPYLSFATYPSVFAFELNPHNAGTSIETLVKVFQMLHVNSRIFSA